VNLGQFLIAGRRTFGGTESPAMWSRELLDLPGVLTDDDGNLTAVELEDGRIGHFQRRIDQCLEAAVATVLRLPYGDVPDFRLRESLESGEAPEEIGARAWAALGGFAARHGLRVVAHERPPTRLRSWIGVVPREQAFRSHSLVMRRTEIAFDPGSAWWHLADGRAFRMRFSPTDVTWGISFQRQGKDKTWPHRS
jgi:hypothetical protein